MFMKRLKAKDTRNQWLREHIAALRDSRHLTVHRVDSRLLRSVRLAFNFARSLIPSIPQYRSSMLFRHLTWVLCLKVLLLCLLWQVLIKPNKLHPDTAMVSDHLLGSAHTRVSLQPVSGESQ